MSKHLKEITILCFALGTLVGCGGSSSSPKQEEEKVIDDTPTPPPYIEDISCQVSYPLTISKIYTEGDDNLINELRDADKTKQQVWKPESIDSKLIIELAEPAQVKQMVVTWKDTEHVNLFNVYSSKDTEQWHLLGDTDQSIKQAVIPDLIPLSASDETAQTALYLQLSLAGNEISQPSELLEIEVFGCSENVAHNIELIDWYLSVQTDEDGNGKSDSIKEVALSEGYFDSRFFSQSNDNGLIFTSQVAGYKTSTNTKYTRTELREMLRRGNTNHSTQGVNKNNWVFSSAPAVDQQNAGAVDGELDVIVAVNEVTSTGEDYQIGRVVIGQIHANDDEPVRLYYRKLPGNDNGAIYIAHEREGADESYYELIGSRSNSASNPADGIPLNEKFTYNIKVEGNLLTVTITKSDNSVYQQTVDMSDSGYDVGGQYMYFKAGVYNLNNSGDPNDFVRATFYQINNTHND